MTIDQWELARKKMDDDLTEWERINTENVQVCALCEKEECICDRDYDEFR